MESESFIERLGKGATRRGNAQNKLPPEPQRLVRTGAKLPESHNGSGGCRKCELTPILKQLAQKAAARIRRAAHFRPRFSQFLRPLQIQFHSSASLLR